MTDAAKTVNNPTPPIEANTAPRRNFAVQQYEGLLDPSSSDHLSAILAKYPVGLTLREIATILERQAGEYLEKDSDFSDPVQSQNAYLKNAQARSLRSILATF